MSAPHPYEERLSHALREGVDWLEEIQRHELLINCRRDGVTVIAPGGRRVTGMDLQAVLQQIIQPQVQHD